MLCCYRVIRFRKFSRIADGWQSIPKNNLKFVWNKLRPSELQPAFTEPGDVYKRQASAV